MIRLPLAVLVALVLASALPVQAAKELRLRSGETMRVQEAVERDGRWHVTLPSGIKLTLPSAKVLELRELDAAEAGRPERISGWNTQDDEPAAPTPKLTASNETDRALMSRIDGLRSAGRHAEAEALLRGELIENPGDALRLVLLGRVLVDADRFGEALEPLRLASPGSDATLRRGRDLALAEALSRLDRVDEALRAIEDTPDDREGSVAAMRARLERDRSGSEDLEKLGTTRFTVHLPEGADRLDLKPLLRELDAAWDELESALGGAPRERVVVIVYPGSEFWETTRMGRNVGGLYDGKVRVPAGRLDPPAPRLAAVLRHELAHAFVDALTGGRSDAVWHEGIAEHFERSELSGVLERRLAAAFERGAWPPSYSHPIAHSRLEWFLGRWGMSGLRELLRQWQRRGNIDAALEAVTGLDLAELERAWGRALVEKWER